MVHLGFGAAEVLLVKVRQVRKRLVRLLLVFEGLAIVGKLVIGMSDRLVARYNLQVALAEKCDVAVEALQEAIDCGLEMLKVLVHKAEV